MGARGPKPLPDSVLARRGTSAGYLANRNPGGRLDPDIEIPDCPRFLLKEARKEWKRITPELERLGLISRIDRAALAMYCQEYAWYVFFDEAFQRDVENVDAKRRDWESNEANAGKLWVGGNGLMVPTPSGGVIYNPNWAARNRHLAQLDRCLANFGLSPSARGKVLPSSSQLQLPGMGEPAPKGAFDQL